MLAAVLTVERRAVAAAPDDAALLAATAAATQVGTPAARARTQRDGAAARAAYAIACRARDRGVAGEALLASLRTVAGAEARALLRAWRPQLLAPPGGGR